MSKLSRQLSHEKKLSTDFDQKVLENSTNPFQDLGRQPNRRTVSHTATKDTFFSQTEKHFLTESCEFKKWTKERGWSICCARQERQQMLFTVNEVAKDHLKVSRATVYRLIRSGELRSSKVLGCTRISDLELRSFERMIGGF